MRDQENREGSKIWFIPWETWLGLLWSSGCVNIWKESQNIHWLLVFLRSIKMKWSTMTIHSFQMIYRHEKSIYKTKVCLGAFIDRNSILRSWGIVCRLYLITGRVKKTIIYEIGGVYSCYIPNIIFPKPTILFPLCSDRYEKTCRRTDMQMKFFIWWKESWN